MQSMSAGVPCEVELPEGLVYTADSEPGITRQRRGKGFSYQLPNGQPVAEKDLQRIRALAIPPAYKNVWICANPRGHLQATGRDARGRKQYRYHPDWIEAQAQSKFEHLLDFGKALPKIRRQISQDLRSRGLNRQRVIAAVIALLERSLIRIGNEEYARQNQSYGLTTILSEHAEANTTSIHFEFVGKSGKPWAVDVRDRQLARIVRQLQELPGQHLFDYLDDKGEIRRVTSSDVNDYLREISPFPVTAKDFRTWAASREAFIALCDAEPSDRLGGRKRIINQVVKNVADLLGNTPAVCRASYIHPLIIETAMAELPLAASPAKDDDRALIRFLQQAGDNR